MRKQMRPKIGDDVLGDQCSQVAVPHRAEALKNHQPKEQRDQLVHAGGIMLDGNDVPQHSCQPK